MDASVLRKMLGVLPDDILMKALSVAIQPSGGDQGGGADFLSALSTGDDGDKIQSWNDRTIPMGDGSERPPMVDKAWAKPKVNANQPVPGGTMTGDMDNYLQTGGT